MFTRRAVPIASALALFVAIACGATGCSSRLLQGSVERRLRNRLATLIGPAQRYTVSISGTDDADLVLGRIRRLEVAGQNVRIGGKFLLQRFELRLEHLRYGGARTDLISVRESDLLVEFTEASLNEYLTAHHSRSGVQARFESESVTLSSSIRFFGVPTPIQAMGRLEIEGAKRIVLRAERVEAPNARLAGPSKLLVERQLNPLVDMQELGVPVRLTDLQVLDGRIIIRGAADLPTPQSGRRQNR
jgi:hypothetical protein